MAKSANKKKLTDKVTSSLQSVSKTSMDADYRKDQHKRVKQLEKEMKVLQKRVDKIEKKRMPKSKTKK